MGPWNCCPTKIWKCFSGASPLNPKVGEQVYSTLGVQTRLNNISEYGRLGSTTNILLPSPPLLDPREWKKDTPMEWQHPWPFSSSQYSRPHWTSRLGLKEKPSHFVRHLELGSWWNLGKMAYIGGAYKPFSSQGLSPPSPLRLCSNSYLILWQMGLWKDWKIHCNPRIRAPPNRKSILFLNMLRGCMFGLLSYFLK